MYAVTFVIPTYNVASYILETLECLASQSVQDFEVVIVDDGSTDGTVDLLESLLPELGPRYRFLRMATNSGGPYQPRKMAFEHANSVWVAPLDADDRVNPDYLESLLKRQSETGADIIYPDMFLYDGVKSRKILPLEDFNSSAVYRGKDLVKDTLGRWRFGAGGGLIRRDLYMKCFEKYDSTVAYTYSDEVLTRQLLIEAPKVAFSSTPYLYRVNPDSATHRVSPAMFMLTRSHRALVKLTETEYGSESETVLAARILLFHGLFEAARFYERARRQGTLTDSLKREALKQLEATWKMIDWKRVRKHVSPRLYLIGRLGVKGMLTALPLYDKIKR